MNAHVEELRSFFVAHEDQKELRGSRRREQSDSRLRCSWNGYDGVHQGERVRSGATDLDHAGLHHDEKTDRVAVPEFQSSMSAIYQESVGLSEMSMMNSERSHQVS